MSSESIAVEQALAPASTKVSRSVFLSARWQLLAMLNWEIDPAIVQPLVPRGCELDFHAGKTYVSVVGFLFFDTRLVGLPIPGYRRFEEVNLRFYVRRETAGEVHRGVAFVREIVPRRAIARVAWLCYNEPYVALPMRHAASGPAAIEALGTRRAGRWRDAPPCGAVGLPGSAESTVRYEWRLGSRWNAIEVGCCGPKLPLAAGSHEEFITEHYYGYCRQRDGGTVEYLVEHPPWNIWPASSAIFDVDAAANYGPALAEALAGPPTTALLADGSPVAVIWPQRIC
jgi:uncharacterized protein YqjF (DUF2071 family)